MTSPSPTASPRAVYTAMLIATLMMAAILTMPALLGALQRGFNLPTSSLGVLAFAELGGFVIATYIASSKDVGTLINWVLMACGLVIAINLACLWLGGQIPLVALRPIAGFGAGIGFGYALKVCSKSARPDQSFGVLTAVFSLMMVFGFQAIARLSGPEAFGAKSVFVLYAALAGVVVLLALSSRSQAAPGSTASEVAPPHGMPAPLVLLGLGAVLLSFMAQGSLWAFLERLGSAHGFPAKGVANALSAFAIMGIVGSLSAASLPQKVPRAMAVLAALCVLLPGFYLLYAPLPFAPFVIGCGIAGFYWNFTLSLQLGILAKIDATGQGAVLGGMMSSLGSALGPLLAGQIISGANFQPVGWLAAVLVSSGVACTLLVSRRT
jgi:predicted MFS family arabinose efflux permease